MEKDNGDMIPLDMPNNHVLPIRPRHTAVAFEK